MTGFNNINSLQPANYEQLFLAQVVYVDDPERKQRIKVTIPNLLEGDVETLPWVLPLQPTLFGVGKNSATDYGHFYVPPIGAKVVVNFERGELYYGRLAGTMQVAGISLAILEVNYPNRYGFIDPAGNHFFVDTTPDAVLVQFRHKSGTVFTIDNEGNVTTTIVGNENTTIQKNLTMFVQENVSVSVQGDTTVAVQGNANVSVQGDTAIGVRGNTTVDVQGDTSVSVTGNTTVTAQSNMTATVGGALSASVAGAASVDVAGLMTTAAPQWNHIGALKVTGNMQLEGSMDIEGNMAVAGAVTGSNGSVSLRNHVHMGVHGQTSAPLEGA